MNGKHGDHPIADIVIHRIAVYGEPVDSQLRQLGELMSYQRLCDCFQEHWPAPPDQLQPIVVAELARRRRDAADRGRETPESHEAPPVATPTI